MQEVVEAKDKELYDLKGNNYCVKSVRIWMSGFYSIRTEYGYTQDRSKSECGKIRTRKTPNTDHFHAMNLFEVVQLIGQQFMKKNRITTDKFINWEKIIIIRLVTNGFEEDSS